MKLGLPLSECMEKTTRRQYLAWSEWLVQEYNQPQREDFYSMLIASEIRRLGHLVVRALLGKDLGDISLKDFLLEFKSSRQEHTPPSSPPHTDRRGARKQEAQEFLRKREEAYKRINPDYTPGEHPSPSISPSFLQEQGVSEAEAGKAFMLSVLKDAPGVKVGEPCVPENPFNPIPEKYRHLTKAYKAGHPDYHKKEG